MDRRRFVTVRGWLVVSLVRWCWPLLLAVVWLCVTRSDSPVHSGPVWVLLVVQLLVLSGVRRRVVSRWRVRRLGLPSPSDRRVVRRLIVPRRFRVAMEASGLAVAFEREVFTRRGDPVPVGVPRVPRLVAVRRHPLGCALELVVVAGFQHAGDFGVALPRIQTAFGVETRVELDADPRRVYLVLVLQDPLAGVRQAEDPTAGWFTK